MADAQSHVDVTCWLQIEPEFSSNDRVRSARVTRMTQKRPQGTQMQGTIMAPITLRIPRSAFMPLSPKIVVTIPEDMITAEPIEIEVSDGNEGK